MAHVVRPCSTHRRTEIVAADVDRPFVRREAGLRVDHVGLSDLIERLRRP